MQTRYTARQVCLMQRLRQLWEQHVYRTRFFIISTAAGLADLAPVTERLLQNPKDFARALTPFFGARTAGQFGDLLTEHLEIGGALVTDLKNRETAKADDARRRWYANADTISAFLAGINACWNEEKWREFFYSHLEMTAKRPRCACRATMRPTSACSTGSRPRRCAWPTICSAVWPCAAAERTSAPAGMTPEGSAFSQNCSGCTTGDTLRCLPLHVKEERTLACTQSANSGVDR